MVACRARSFICGLGSQLIVKGEGRGEVGRIEDEEARLEKDEKGTQLLRSGYAPRKELFKEGWKEAEEADNVAPMGWAPFTTSCEGDRL